MKYQELVPYKKAFIVETIALCISLLMIALAILLSGRYVYLNGLHPLGSTDSYLLVWELMFLTLGFVLLSTGVIYLHAYIVTRRITSKMKNIVFVIVALCFNVLLGIFAAVLLKMTILASGDHFALYLYVVSGLFLVELAYFLYLFIITNKIYKFRRSD